MKFDSYDTETYYYEQARQHGLGYTIPNDRNMIWTRDDVDNLMLDLEKMKEEFQDK